MKLLLTRLICTALLTAFTSSFQLPAQTPPPKPPPLTPEQKAEQLKGAIEKGVAQLPAGSAHFLEVPYVVNAKPTTSPDSSQTLDLFVPPGAGPFPLILWIHGGGWHGGNKETSGVSLAHKFLPAGFALAAVAYRLTPDAAFPAQIEDCNAALIFLRKHATEYHLDPDHVGTVGHSAGAHLSALMAVTGDSNVFSPDPSVSVRVQASVCWATPCDLDRVRANWPQNSMLYNMKDPFWYFFPNKTYDENFARKASPASYVHAGLPPMLIVHGAKDNLVPLGQVTVFVDKLKQAGDDVTFRLDPDHGHDVMNATSIDEAIPFFQRTLKPVSIPSK